MINSIKKIHELAAATGNTPEGVFGGRPLLSDDC